MWPALHQSLGLAPEPEPSLTHTHTAPHHTHTTPHCTTQHRLPTTSPPPPPPRHLATTSTPPRRQLDLRAEAAHLLAFRRNFEEVPASAHAHFPRPLAEQGLVSRRVLVESWAEGPLPPPPP